MQARILGVVAVRQVIGWQTKPFAGPSPQIDVFAPRAAKWPIGIGHRVNAFPATAWTHDDLHRDSVIVHVENASKNILPAGLQVRSTESIRT
jgi:hypothetical protein